MKNTATTTTTPLRKSLFETSKAYLLDAKEATILVEENRPPAPLGSIQMKNEITSILMILDDGDNTTFRRKKCGKTGSVVVVVVASSYLVTR